MTTYKIPKEEKLKQMPKAVFNPPKPMPELLKIDPVVDAEIEEFFADFKL